MSKQIFPFWDLLQSQSVLTIATADASGCWSAPVLYAADLVDERPVLYFLSAPASRHINHSPQSGVAASIYTSYDGDWQAIKGLQMQGAIAEISKNHRQQFATIYFARFPEIAKIIHSPTSEQQQKIAAAFEKSGYYSFTPTYIRATDNADQFANRREWNLLS